VFLIVIFCVAGTVPGGGAGAGVGGVPAGSSSETGAGAEWVPTKNARLFGAWNLLTTE